MNKKTLWIIVGIVICIVMGLVYLLSGDDSRQAKEQMTNNDSSAIPETVQPPTAATPGAYVDYSEGIIARSPGTKLLFFYAAWCPQCRALEADIKQNGVPDGVTIIKVDYDTSQALRQKYGVALQTTIVRVDDNGGLVKKFVAYDDPSVRAVKENVL